MSDWKTLDEILPEMGRAAEADPENWPRQFEINIYGEVYSLERHDHFSPEHKYRLKPRTMTYTVERPEPMLEHPEIGQEYWAPQPTNRSWAINHDWNDDDVDFRLFNRGLCYGTKEEAVAAAKAMVGGE